MMIYSTPKLSNTNLLNESLNCISKDCKSSNTEKLKENIKTSIISIVSISLIYVKDIIL